MSEEMSKSKKKRLAIKEERSKQKKKKFLTGFLSIIIPIAVLAAAVGAIFYLRNVSKANTIEYSKYLAEDGTIANISIDDYIDFNYEDMTFSKADLLPSDELVNNDINNLVGSYAAIPENDTAVSKAGDKINICYKSSIDGVSYNEVTSESGGADFTIGDAVISEDFDKALTGHKKGDTFSTDVKYADDYGVADLAGKTVTYDITFNGVYVTPDFDDAFVKEHLSDVADSADAYRVMVVNDYYESNLSSKITDSLSANYVIKNLPEEYLANDEKVLKEQTKKQFEYYNQMYASYGLETMNQPYEMFGLSSDAELDVMIHESAVDETEMLLAYQYVFVHAGLTNTPEQVREYFADMGYDDAAYNEYVNEYGYNYVACAALQGNVLRYLVENVNITP